MKNVFRIPFGRGQFIYAFAVLLASCGICGLAEGQTAQPIVGVWSQPVSSFAVWQARGVNTLFRWENQGGLITVDAYCKAATVAGLQYILQDDGTAAAHYADPNCIAVAMKDEPNGAGAMTTAQVAQKAAADRALTPKPRVLNFDGWKLQYESDTEVQAYCASGDWLALDYYVINRGEAAGIGAWAGKVLPQIRRLQNFCPGKPVLVFIETSNQLLSQQSWSKNPDASGTPPGPRMRGPTTGEFVAEQIAARKWVDGIVYFPDVIGTGWISFDGTPDDISLAMAVLNH